MKTILKIGLVLYFAAAIALIEFPPQARYAGRKTDDWAEAMLRETGPEASRGLAFSSRSWQTEGFDDGGITSGPASLDLIGATAPTRDLAAGGRDALAVLIELLEHRHWYIRAEAAFALGVIGEDAFPAAFALASAAENESSVVRLPATYALARTGLSRFAMPHLLRRLEDEDSMVRVVAAGGLGYFECPDRAIDPLRRALRDEDGTMRHVAVWALGQAGERGRRAVPDLLALVERDEDRKEALLALGTIGPAARDAVPALIDLARTRPGSRVLQALGEIGDPRAAPILLELLAGASVEVRCCAAWALAHLDGDRDDVAGGLRRALGDADERVRDHAALGLEQKDSPRVLAPRFGDMNRR